MLYNLIPTTYLKEILCRLPYSCTEHPNCSTTKREAVIAAATVEAAAAAAGPGYLAGPRGQLAGRGYYIARPGCY